MSLLSFIKISFKNVLAYKFEVLLWSIVTPITLAVYYFLWKSIYSYTGQEIIRGFTFYELLSYFVIIEIVAVLTWTHVDDRLARRILKGDLVKTLVRPASVYINFLFQEFGMLLFFIPADIPTLIIIGVLFFKLKLASLTLFSLFAISIILSIILFYSFSFLLGMSAFWLKEYSGIRMMKNGIIWLFGGGLMPLAFFPSFAQKLMSFLPFQYMLYTPTQIYLGNFALNEIFKMLTIQVVWIVIFYVSIQFIWKKGMLEFAGVGV